jgi:hypothetical protein
MPRSKRNGIVAQGRRQVHLRKTSPWKRVVIEALTHRGFLRR